jgi:hypothetical protein
MRPAGGGWKPTDSGLKGVMSGRWQEAHIYRTSKMSDTVNASGPEGNWLLA